MEIENLSLKNSKPNPLSLKDQETKLSDKSFFTHEKSLARFLTFSFASNPKLRNKVSEGKATILDPEGRLAVINVKVEAKRHLPGAVAQDVLTGLMDMCVYQNALDVNKDSSMKHALSLLPSKVDTTCSVLTRKAHLMKHIGKHEKNSTKQLNSALSELMNTNITIQGSIYTIINGKSHVLTINHNTHYIQSWTTGDHTVDGKLEKDILNVSLDKTIVNNILGGFVATIDKNIYLSLQTGMLKKLYSILCSIDRIPNTNDVIVSQDELMLSLQMTEKQFRKSHKKIFNQLIEKTVIESWVETIHQGAVFFMFKIKTHNALAYKPNTEKEIAEKTFDNIRRAYSLQQFRSFRKNINQVIEQCDIDELVLEQLLKKHKKEQDHLGVKVNVVLLSFESLIYSALKGIEFMSMKAVINSILKGKNIIEFEKGFKLSTQILLENEAFIKNEQLQKSRIEKAKAEKQTIDQHVEIIWTKMNDSDRQKMIACAKESLENEMLDNEEHLFSKILLSDARVESRAKSIIELCIKEGLSPAPITDVIKWFKTKMNGKIES